MSRGSLGLFVVAALALALSLPAAAIAGGGHHQPCTSSAVCQYLEHIPGPTGDQSTSPGGGGGGSNGGGQPTVSPAVQQALESHGAVGAKTAALANATAPAGVPGSGGSGSMSDGSTSDHGALAGAGGGPDATGGAPEIGTALSHVLGAGGSGSGMGIALPIIMLLSLVAALLLAIARRRGAIQS